MENSATRIYSTCWRLADEAESVLLLLEALMRE